jgi:hypothetical protein
MMRSVVSNVLFVFGWSLVTWGSFEIHKSLGLLVSGVPFVALSLFLQKKTGSKPN